MAGKTSAARVAVSAAQSAVEVDLGGGGGGGGGGVRVCVPFAWLYSPLPGSGIFSLTCLQQFLQQAEPADAVCCAVLPDLCIDIQTFHVALVDIFISQLGATLGVFYLNQVD